MFVTTQGFSRSELGPSHSRRAFERPSLTRSSKMLGIRASTSSIATSKQAAFSFISLYSTVSGLAFRKWGVVGPTPPSLVEAEEEEHAEPPPKQSRAAMLRSKAEDSPTPSQFKAHREAMKKNFPEGWAPPRKLSRQAMDGLRSLNAHDPDMFTTPVLAEKFKISPEAVRRILRSKWVPSKDVRARLLARERRSREEWIQERRMEERQRQAELRRSQARREPSDKFSLQ